MKTIDVIDNYFEHYKLIKFDDANDKMAIELYHTWYDAALELFSVHFQSKDKFYDKFISVDNSGNGFALHHNFNAIRSAYIVLSNRLKSKEHNVPQEALEGIFTTGCVWDAWAFVSELVRNATQRIILIDNYVDDSVLSLFSKRAPMVSAMIYTRYNKQLQTDITKHNEQYPAIVFSQLSHKNHDRFLIIDDKMYLLGTSLKDIGKSLSTIIEMHIKPEVILDLIKK